MQYYSYYNSIKPDNIKALTDRYKDRKPERFKILKYKNISPNKYIISSYGRIFYRNSGHEVMQKNTDQFKTVSLSCLNKKDSSVSKENFFVHDLVAYMFIRNSRAYIKDGYVPIHLNHIRSCNYCENIIYGEVKDSSTRIKIAFSDRV